MARRRDQWLTYRGDVDPKRLVFIDETWVKTNMAPLRGWGPRGKRLTAKAPHRRWKTMTFLAALRHDRVDAPWLIDGPINGERFRLYVEQVLAPTLTPTPKRRAASRRDRPPRSTAATTRARKSSE